MKAVESIKVFRLYGDEDLEEVLRDLMTEELITEVNPKTQDCE